MNRRVWAVIVVLLLMAAFGVYVFGNAQPNGWSWMGWSGVAAVSTFLAVALALILSLAGDSLTKWGVAPKLSLTLEPNSFHFQRFLLSEGAGASEYDVRISVVNSGNAAAKTVELFGEDLEIQQPDGKFARDLTFMPMNLLVTHTGELATAVVHVGISKPFDLLNCHYRQPKLVQIRTFVSAEKVDPGGGQEAGYPNRKPAGTYRLGIAIAADGVVVDHKVVQFTWSGNYIDDRDAFFKDELKVGPISSV